MQGIHHVIFTSSLLAFVLSIFEFLFTYFFLIPTLRKSAETKIGDLGVACAKIFKREVPDPLARDALNSYLVDFQETTRYTMSDVVSEEKQLYNFERVQFSVIITAALATVVILQRLRWGPERTPLNANTLKSVVLSLVLIGLFQLVFFLVFTRRYKTWNDTEILHHLLKRVEPVLASGDRVVCPPPATRSDDEDNDR
jgi:hypothetical protein